MNSILLAVITVTAIGIVCAVLLVVVSHFMRVPVDEKAEHITSEILPGANCGSCGYSGCSGYAAALSKGETTATNLCNPGGKEVSEQIAEYLGLSAGEMIKQSAVVMCRGCKPNEDKMIYDGVKTCALAANVQGGPKRCSYGCIGFGDCVKVCERGAIRICDGTANVDPTKCGACKQCVAVCPRKLIEIVPFDTKKSVVMCDNKEKGAQAKKNCQNACIGCMKCVKSCEQGAITVVSFNAHIDSSKCIGCGKCVETCPMKCITELDF